MLVCSYCGKEIVDKRSVRERIVLQDDSVVSCSFHNDCYFLRKRLLKNNQSSLLEVLG